ncbi:NifU family protein [Saccharopolyspora phatthalungensis]|uniref:Fe-S cluster biogenesis protein NfuA/nitrite reductase/ring-hydroxylating ferredoxin subunit n=1 Tax=Saccharopolyspora phatthalungensis TaxID=664693 RepID=A0A840Q8L8_9PSEU|nr:NifU family protein [Saccharopolyspora phatthalungensis]MBB5157084.1 Fe-S cluster biogenesis protein NfuA/nitrite reductase/ring-hydroxylating ferredoxin subunit [Saccharopolyspora phatthalungensis]
MEHDARALGMKIEALLEELDSTAEPGVRARVEDLVGAVIGFYGAGLARVVSILREQDGGQQRLRALAEDDLLAGLLALHDLHPDDADTRIQAALDRVRPYLGSHAGGIDYVGIDADGVVGLRLRGSCDGCPSSTVTVKLAVEQAVLDAAPEATSVAVEGMVEEPAQQPLLQISMERVRSESGPTSAWQPLEVEVAPGELRVSDIAGLAVMTCNVRGTYYAYRDECAACGCSLADAAFTGTRLVCSRCGQVYDVCLAGRAEDDPELALAPLPLLPEADGWSIALPQRAAT